VTNITYEMLYIVYLVKKIDASLNNAPAHPFCFLLTGDLH